jgi:TPP-dependent pyruvate/acetoin dehydrogenase alpha subunit
MPRKDHALLLHFYEDMLRIRFFEETVRDVMLPQRLFRGSSHLSIGQEAVAVGAIHALQPDDFVMSTHRGHAHALARGLDPYAAFAEIMGRRTGCCMGKGGSMHLSDAPHHFMGENPVVGSNAPMACGLALAAQLEGKGRLAASFFGEGALNTGAFNEAANMAALWSLPVLLVCENNLWAISVPLEKSSAILELENRACSFGLSGRRRNGMRVWDVYQAIREAAENMRQHPRPAFFVFDTYRFEGHHTADKQTYRTRGQVVEEFRERDPIHILEREMIEDHTVSLDEAIATRDRIRAEIDDAFARALEAPWPDPEEALQGAYADEEVV